MKETVAFYKHLAFCIGCFVFASAACAAPYRYVTFNIWGDYFGNPPQERDAREASMLKNLNPSFVLDLTATPRQNSNIISIVDAREMKRENMVKLPVIVYNRHTKQDVLTDAIQLRGSIEQDAIAEEEAGSAYIRPIVLLQAQPKSKDDSITFEQIKKKLLSWNIPENQIKIKTANVDEIKNINLK